VPPGKGGSRDHSSTLKVCKIAREKSSHLKLSTEKGSQGEEEKKSTGENEVRKLD